MEKKILIIDDSHFFLHRLALSLERAGYTVITATTGEEGLRLVKSEKPDLLLLDIMMQEMSGFDICRQLRQSEAYELMPIIILSALDTLEDKLAGLELGADDYITKPFDERELLVRIRNTLRRVARNRSANPLTGLPGNDDIQREISARIELNEPFAVIYADIDNFKSYNDVYGFIKGDAAIKLTAEILCEEMARIEGDGDFIGHIGGDDFVLISAPKSASTICEGIISVFDVKIRSLFTQRDLERGYISTVNRRNEVENFPIMTISLAIITNEHRTFENHLTLSEVASELKQKLKTIPGSNYLFDRRTDTTP